MTARAARLTVLAGLLVMVGAGIVASRYTSLWFDPAQGCEMLGGRCATPATEVVFRLMHWAVAAGFAIVLTGVVAAGRSLPAPPSAPSMPLSAPARAVAAGVIGLALCAVLGVVVLLAATTTGELLPAALCLLWLVQARAVVALDRAAAPAHRSSGRRWAVGFAASALALGVTMWLATGPVRGLLPVADAAVLASVVLVEGVLPATGERVHRPRLAVAVLAAAVVVAAAGYAVVDRPDAVEHAALPGGEQVQQLPPVPHAAPAPATAVPRPAPAPGTAGPPAPVVARVACTAADLEWSTTGWDAAMGSRTVTVVATDRAARPCYVDGFASVTLSQGGRPLQLVTETGFSAPSAERVPAERIGVAPGGSAGFVLFWKGYGTAADQETPQSLAVALAGSGEQRDVRLTRAAPAPFDLVDGGTVEIGPWQPLAP